LVSKRFDSSGLDVLTIPNLLTMARALGIPVFLYLVLIKEQMVLAILTLVIAGATDYFDGKLARAWNQESRLGELMDPAVDRLYIISVLIAMFATQVVPLWVLALIAGRDVLLGFLLVVMKSKRIPPFKVTYLGKAATFNLLYALPLLLLTDSTSGPISDAAYIFGWGFAGWGIGLYLFTGLSYARAGIKSLKRG
jgi:cardiolipin synthase